MKRTRRLNNVSLFQHLTAHLSVLVLSSTEDLFGICPPYRTPLSAGRIKASTVVCTAYESTSY